MNHRGSGSESFQRACGVFFLLEMLSFFEWFLRRSVSGAGTEEDATGQHAGSQRQCAARAAV